MTQPLRYLTGFGAHFESEAVDGALPKGRNSPQRPPHGLYAELISGTSFTTPRGDFVVKLRPDLAPQTVNSFVFLAKAGFFNGLTWHRVLPNFMAQGGERVWQGPHHVCQSASF